VSLVATSYATSTGGDRSPRVATASAQTFGQDIQVMAYAEAMRSAEIADALRTIAYAEAVASIQRAEALRSIAYAQAVVANTQAPPPATRVSPAARHVVPPAARPASHDAAFSAAVFDELNRRRAAAGLGPVAGDGRLAAAAASYAQTMLRLNLFGHSVDGTTFDARIRAAGFMENVVLGEIIAMSTGTITPSKVVEVWMDSPPHRTQILSATFRVAGAGCAITGSELRCVVEFAS
jgi:uncharacterized protein YkwD